MDRYLDDDDSHRKSVLIIQKMGLISQKFREVLFAHEESSQVGFGWLLASIALARSLIGLECPCTRL